MACLPLGRWRWRGRPGSGEPDPPAISEGATQLEAAERVAPARPFPGPTTVPGRASFDVPRTGSQPQAAARAGHPHRPAGSRPIATHRSHPPTGAADTTAPAPSTCLAPGRSDRPPPEPGTRTGRRLPRPTTPTGGRRRQHGAGSFDVPRTRSQPQAAARARHPHRPAASPLDRIDRSPGQSSPALRLHATPVERTATGGRRGRRLRVEWGSVAVKRGAEGERRRRRVRQRARGIERSRKSDGRDRVASRSAVSRPVPGCEVRRQAAARARS